MSNVNLTYIRIDLARCFRDVTNLLFTFAMPVFMYLLFGRAQYSDFQSGRGTVGFYVMSSMGAYGAVIAATAVSAMPTAANAIHRTQARTAHEIFFHIAKPPLQHKDKNTYVT